MRALKALIPALVVSVLGGASTASAEGVYGFGISGQYGNALVPPTASPVFVTSLSYREYAGVIGNLLIFIGSIPVAGGPVETRTYETDSQGNVWETTTKRRQTAEELAVTSAWLEGTGKAILRGEMGQEVQLDVALPELGGNASGVMFKLYRPVRWDGEAVDLLGGGSRIWIAQFNLGHLKFSDVRSRLVSADNGVLMSTERVGPQDLTMVGSAVRIDRPLTSSVRAHLEIDLNVFSLIEDAPSPIHLGVQVAGPHLLMKFEAMTTGFRPEGLSLNAEVILAF